MRNVTLFYRLPRPMRLAAIYTARVIGFCLTVYSCACFAAVCLFALRYSVTASSLAMLGATFAGIGAGAYLLCLPKRLQYSPDVRACTDDYLARYERRYGARGQHVATEHPEIYTDGEPPAHDTQPPFAARVLHLRRTGTNTYAI